MKTPTLTALGNLIGGARYFGQCANGCCQFHSTHDRVAEIERPYNNPKYPGLTYTVIVCAKCAVKAGA